MKPPDDFLETMKGKAVAYISKKYGISPRNIEITQNVGGGWNIYITVDCPEVRCDFESDANSNQGH